MTGDTPSKTQRKREMHELQELGAELVELSEQQFATIELPEQLRDAVMDARRITRFEARRRQLQYIGKLMRAIDPEPIRAKLDVWKSVSRAQVERLKLIERWRTRLIDDETALALFLAEHPKADAARLSLLAKNVRRESEAGLPPKSYRALFRLLDELIP